MINFATYLRPRNFKTIKTTPKITARLIDAIEPEDKDIIIRDSELKGFLCKVTPKGKKVYMLYYRTKDYRERRPVIGVHGHITCYQAREIALKWLAEVAQGNDPSLERKSQKIDITISELADRYLTDYAITYKKQRSVEHDRYLLTNFVIPQLGKIKLKSLTGKDIANLHKKLRDKSTTANRCISIISTMMNLAEKWGLRDDVGSLCKHIDKYPENKRERFLSIEEITRLSNVLKEMTYTATESPSALSAIKLLLLTGCRLSEILTLKWEYLDLDHHRINFPDSKTGKKTVYISPMVIELLKNTAKKDNNPYVITGQVEGKHLINLQKPWRRIRKLAELDEVRIHDLRHSFASVGAASGLSLPIIGALLGHSQTQTTARYAHLIGDPLKEAASLINEKMRGLVA